VHAESCDGAPAVELDRLLLTFGSKLRRDVHAKRNSLISIVFAGRFRNPEMQSAPVTTMESRKRSMPKLSALWFGDPNRRGRITPSNGGMR
jgi:hypothetical protein